MRWAERRRRFRAILGGSECVFPASVHDPLSARIAEDLGFEMGMFAGSTASLVVLGAPDVLLVTLTEFAEQAYRICRAGNLPLLVDADHGYGNALNVRRTVEELENAGVAGLTIEDTLLPTPHGGSMAGALTSIEEGVGKMKAALSGRRDPDLVICGRTSAVMLSDVDDAVARIRAYDAAGVDAIFLVGVRTMAELDAVSAATKLPIVLGSAAPSLMDRGMLASKGVRVCLQGHLPISAAVKAMHDTLKQLREGTPPGEVKTGSPPDLTGRVTRADEVERWFRDFLAVRPK